MYVHVQRLMQCIEELFLHLSVKITSVTQGVDIILGPKYTDGHGYGPQSTCCSFNYPPWFCKQLPQPTRDYIEVRLCGDESTDNEDANLLSFIYSKYHGLYGASCAISSTILYTKTSLDSVLLLTILIYTVNMMHYESSIGLEYTGRTLWSWPGWLQLPHHKNGDIFKPRYVCTSDSLNVVLALNAILTLTTLSKYVLYRCYGMWPLSLNVLELNNEKAS